MVRVTAGDFGATSRIAFNFRPENGFRVERDDRRITVHFPGTLVRFAYEPVYPQRKASRVVFAGSEDRTDGSAFTLRFACACEADVSLDQSSRVLVHIHEKGVLSATVPQLNSTGNTPPGAADANSSTPFDRPVSDLDASGAAPPPADRDAASHLPRPRPKNRRASDGAPLAEFAAADESVPPASGVLAAHEIDRLRQSLEWAAKHGFLDRAGDVDLSETPVQAGPPPANIANLPAKRPPLPTGKPIDPAGMTNPRRVAEISPPPTDHVAAEDGPETGSLPLGNVTWTCTGPVEPPVVDWPSAGHLNGDFATALARQHSTVADMPPAAAMRSMTLFYLAQGLTREALAAHDSIRQSDVREDGRDVASPVLREVILVLLGRGDEAGPALLAASPCHSDMAIWRAAMLKAHGYRKLAEWAATQANEALAGFPPFVRTQLALDLADAAINRGNAALADAYLALVEPAAGQDVAGQIALLEGRKALAQNLPQRANWYFSQALDADPDIRTRTRLAMIQYALDHDAPLPPWAADVTRGALFDYRNDRRLTPVTLVAATVAAAAGEFEEALDTLDAATRRLPPALNRAPLAEKAKVVLSKALGSAETDDAKALQLYTDYRHFLGNDPADRKLGEQVARRMLDAGLPSAARRILRSLAPSEAPEAGWGLLLAEAALRAGEAEAALAALDRLPVDPATYAKATMLRQRTLVSLRRYEDAAKSTGAAQEPNDADLATTAELLWAASNWPDSADAFRKLLAAQTGQVATGPIAVRALAAAYMAGGPDRLGDEANKAIALAAGADLADAAAALTAAPLGGNLSLPDSIASVLNRSRQVSRIFPPEASQNRPAPTAAPPTVAKGS